MKIVSTIYNALALAEGVVTEGNLTRIDMGNLAGAGREFALSASIAEGSTAPGSAKTVTINYYWSDLNLGLAGAGGGLGMADADIIVRLAPRKTAATAMTRSTVASKTLDFSTVATPFRPLARYLYVSVTKTDEDNGAVATLTLRLIRVPSTAKDL